MRVVSYTEKLISYLLMALIAGFFLIPAAAYCFFDCRLAVPKKMASILIVFFR